MIGDIVSFNNGDFIKVEYSAWRASDGAMVYTTQKDVAEKNDIYNKDRAYGPSLVIIGKHTVIKGLEKAIREMGINESRKIEVSAEEAFGERNPELVRVMHASLNRSSAVSFSVFTESALSPLISANAAMRSSSLSTLETTFTSYVSLSPARG